MDDTLSARYAKRPGRGVLRIWWREEGADAARVRRIRRERIRTAEWLALERVARKGWVHGCTQQSLATDRYQHGAPRKGRFAYLAERKGCRGRAGSTDSPGANPDSRMAGPVARSAEGLGAWMHPTIPGHRSLSARSAPKGAFCVSGGEKKVPRPRGFDGFAGSESGQPNGWPWSAQRGRVGCMDAPNNLRPPIAISTERPERGVTHHR